MGIPRSKVEVFQGRGPRKRSTIWRWRVRVNGRVMAASGEGYSRRRAAWRAWDQFRTKLGAGKVQELTSGELGRGN